MMEQLIKDLTNVFKKHKISLTEIDSYDGEENYVGKDQYFKINGNPDYSKTTFEILEQIFKNL